MRTSTHHKQRPRRSSSTLAVILATAVGLAATAPMANAQRRPEAPERPRDDSPNNPGRPPNQGPRIIDFDQLDLDLRTIDGVANNLDNPSWGSANTTLLRLADSDYADGLDAPSGENRPSARVISNLCMAQEGSIENEVNATDMLWQWGQFLDHDIDLTPIAEPVEEFPIHVPTGDPWFDPTGSGTAEIPLERSSYEIVEDVREQVNEITAYIDASNVYGSDEERARDLRTLDGTGRLRTSEGDLLPFNLNGLPNAPSDSADFFIAGDFRANEQVGLTAMHTLFVREHNFWANRIAEANPGLEGDQIYEFARMIVAAEMQAITYREFLPVLLGRDALPPYRGYRSEVNAGIANEFATAAYRVGHTMLSSLVHRLEEDGSESPEGHLTLAQAFFNPNILIETGIDSLLRGLVSKRAQAVDLKIIDDVRNLLFGPPGAGGLDLASLNIQRGRDHGLADFNATRRAYGLEPARRFGDVTSDQEIVNQLRQLYGTPRNIDLWVGGLAEPPVEGAMVGETFRTILADQFRRLRDGDRFWYESYLPPSLRELVEQQTLARIIRRNTGISGDFLQQRVFRMSRAGDDSTSDDGANDSTE